MSAYVRGRHPELSGPLRNKRQPFLDVVAYARERHEQVNTTRILFSECGIYDVVTN